MSNFSIQAVACKSKNNGNSMIVFHDFDKTKAVLDQSCFIALYGISFGGIFIAPVHKKCIPLVYLEEAGSHDVNHFFTLKFCFK